MAEASMATDMREKIVAEARSWIGTPYHHQASLKGAGTDCLGLLRGVWRELHGGEPQKVPPYAPDWAEATGEETLRDAAAHHLAQVSPSDAAAGDVLLFRMSHTAPAKHCGIATGSDHMVHAWSRHAVAEVQLGVFWRRRLVYAFRFPGVD